MDSAMKSDLREIARRMERFEKACRDRGIKLTHQRIEIFREVAESDEHPDAETVYRGVRDRMPTVSLDTVYRTLWLLNDLGLIATLGPSQARARFDANLNRHHHYICTECGLTRDVYNKEYDDLRIPESVHSLGQVETTHVEVKGICLDCIDRGKSKQKRGNEGRKLHE